MNRVVRRAILFEAGWAAGALVSGWCEFDSPRDVMLGLEKNVLLPRHIGIAQSTWDTCILAMNCLPLAAGILAFVLSCLLTGRLLRRWELSQPAGQSPGMVSTRYGRIANGGGFCVAVLLLLPVGGSILTADDSDRLRPEAWHWLPSFRSNALILLLLPSLVAALVTELLLFLQHQRARPGHCGVCSYNLTGNVSGVCPECGTAVPGRDSAKPGDGVD